MGLVALNFTREVENLYYSTLSKQASIEEPKALTLDQVIRSMEKNSSLDEFFVQFTGL